MQESPLRHKNKKLLTSTISPQSQKQYSDNIESYSNLLLKEEIIIFIQRGAEIHESAIIRESVATGGHSERRKTREMNTELFKQGM